MSPRTSASNFITTMASKRAKHHMPQLMVRLVEVMNAYAAAGEQGGCVRGLKCTEALRDGRRVGLQCACWKGRPCTEEGYAGLCLGAGQLTKHGQQAKMVWGVSIGAVASNDNEPAAGGPSLCLSSFVCSEGSQRRPCARAASTPDGRCTAGHWSTGGHIESQGGWCAAAAHPHHCCDSWHSQMCGLQPSGPADVAHAPCSLQHVGLRAHMHYDNMCMDGSKLAYRMALMGLLVAACPAVRLMAASFHSDQPNAAVLGCGRCLVLCRTPTAASWRRC